MKSFLKLYPRSWRQRYGPEMEVLLEEGPGGPGVALDLLFGAAAAYAMVVRSNRILSTAGAYLHGVCVAVLLQAIGFVTLVMVAQGSPAETNVAIGPFDLAMVQMRTLLRLGGLQSYMMSRGVSEWPALLLLVCLVAALALVVASPRLLRSVR